jgi:peptidyl-dipeptidase Dcp
VHDREIKAITDNKAKATFQNTVALETSGVDLTRARTIFYNLTGSNTNPTLQALQALHLFFSAQR